MRDVVSGASLVIDGFGRGLGRVRHPPTAGQRAAGRQLGIRSGQDVPFTVRVTAGWTGATVILELSRFIFVGIIVGGLICDQPREDFGYRAVGHFTRSANVFTAEVEYGKINDSAIRPLAPIPQLYR